MIISHITFWIVACTFFPTMFSFLEMAVDMLKRDTQYILHEGHQDKKSCSSTTYNDVDYVPLKIY